MATKIIPTPPTDGLTLDEDLCNFALEATYDIDAMAGALLQQIGSPTAQGSESDPNEFLTRAIALRVRSLNGFLMSMLDDDLVETPEELRRRFFGEVSHG